MSTDSRASEGKADPFLLVGVMNAAFGYGCFAAFLYLGLHYSLALLLATILGVLFNFKSIGALVFGSKKIVSSSVSWPGIPLSTVSTWQVLLRLHYWARPPI